jgi:Heterokaryon incompatibility protein (HET)
MDGDASGGFWWDYEHMLQDSSFGCHLCELMKASMESSVSEIEYADLSRARPVSLSVYYVPSKKGLADLQVRTLKSDEHEYSGSLSLQRKSRSGGWVAPEEQEHSQGRADSLHNPLDEKLTAPMGKCTGSDANFVLARKWIKTCREGHIKCNKGRSTAAIHPSRLVHVGTETQDPHLHEVDPGQTTPDYLTLSHCWGGQSPVTLKSALLTDFKNQIPFSLLSRTFQEALTVVRSLGYSYIWIDSLCIIQDLSEDWERESQIMGDIYQNSVLTIAATASKNGDEGCFRLRNTLRERPCLLWEDDDRGIFVETVKNDVVKRYRREVNNGPLNVRAWVLQERVLSSRVIHYAASSVYWDCQEAHISDSGRELADNREEESSVEPSRDEDLRLFGDIDWSVEKYFSDRWRFNVEQYCNMKLTVESDRYVAFTGIIKYVEEVTGLHCVFGLWKEYLLAHMLWRVENSYTAYRISAYQKPSWSWASVAGLIRYFQPKDYQSYTFWYPENWSGFPTTVLDHNDPDSIEKLVEDMFDQFGKVDPMHGYSAQEVYCSKYIPENSTDNTICISGKLAKAYGSVIVVQDIFTDVQKDMIVNILHVTTFGYRLLVCVWPDVASRELSKDFLYLRINAQGVKSPLIAGFLRDRGTIDPQNPDTNYLAPYAVHSSGLVLEPSLPTKEHRRVGYFRAIETFATCPPPHPEGINVEASFYREGWFGDGCVTSTVKIV